MSFVNKETPHPPNPPEIKREVNLYPVQAAWFACTLVVIVLALLGVFGETFDSASAESDTLEMQVEYPSRFRYKMVNPLTVTIENTSDAAIDVLTVEFERRYVDQFSTVTFTPSVETVTENAYEVELTDIQPGETRIVTVELQGDHYWQHEGTISASVDGDTLVEVTVSTFIFP